MGKDKIHNCPQCGSEMKLEKEGHVRSEYGSKCRIRRFRCSVCDTVDTIYADGEIDIRVYPELALSDQKKYYQEEEQKQKR